MTADRDFDMPVIVTVFGDDGVAVFPGLTATEARLILSSPVPKVPVAPMKLSTTVGPFGVPRTNLSRRLSPKTWNRVVDVAKSDLRGDALVRAMKDVAALGPDVVRAAVRAFYESDALTYIVASRTMGYIADPDAFDLLIEIADEESPQLMAESLRAIVNMRELPSVGGRVESLLDGMGRKDRLFEPLKSASALIRHPDILDNHAAVDDETAYYALKFWVEEIRIGDHRLASLAQPWEELHHRGALELDLVTGVAWRAICRARVEQRMRNGFFDMPSGPSWS